MSFFKTSCKHIGRLLYTLWSGTFRIWRIFNIKNFKVLIKAIQEEPLDLIFENFQELLQRGEGQSVYTDKFIDADDNLKAYLLSCRKEAGILKVVVWILARNGLESALLFADDKPLEGNQSAFIKPELLALFSDFSAFQQEGIIIQLPFEQPFANLRLELSDLQGNQINIGIGRLFQYDLQIQTQGFEALLKAQDRLVILLHDWDLPEECEEGALSDVPQIGPSGYKTIFCSRKSNSYLGHDLDKSAIPILERNELSDYLKLQDFDHLLLLSCDTWVPEHFFSELVPYLSDHTPVDVLYFDEALLGAGKTWHSPSLKPVYSPEYLASDNYIGVNFCLSKNLAERIDWFSDMDFISGAYDLLLRAMEQTSHFNRLPGLRLYRPDRDKAYFSKKAQIEVGVRQRHFSGLGISVHSGLVAGSSEVLRPVRRDSLVSIIIPFKDQVELLDQCLRSIFAKTRYRYLEILLVSNNSEEEKTYLYLEDVCKKHAECRWMRWDHPFNYAGLNNWAAQQAAGQFLLFLNNDVEVITEAWITKMLSYCEEEAVGAVGVKLLYPEKTIQHAGILIGIGGIAGHGHKHYPDNFSSYCGRADKVQNLSACTAACLLVRRSLFQEVGAFDDRHLPVAFNDVDLCLKIITSGKRIVYTPFVKLYHYESISRGAEDTPAKRRRAKREIGFFRKKWRKLIKSGDPYYHPELSKRRGDFEQQRR